MLVTPPFPEYTSGSTFSASAAAVLTNLIGANVGFSSTSLGTPGIFRNFMNFTVAANEVGISRIYGGIHFNSGGNLDGLSSGTAVGNFVLQTKLLAV